MFVTHQTNSHHSYLPCCFLDIVVLSVSHESFGHGLRSELYKTKFSIDVGGMKERYMMGGLRSELKKA